ncbi:hypothetical protein KQX54_017645 [Cotesia glomerata]|uniref:Uncharacterized protein n=1 Tax=Cotesia glomerata TaxID=32391 RepID=A0AAV7IGE1_COTGL|nr:hypothetical protein KQX54_017645 [Cotesia glomerata]
MGGVLWGRASVRGAGIYVCTTGDINDVDAVDGIERKREKRRVERTGEDLEDLSPMIVAGWIEEEPRAVIIAKYEKQAFTREHENQDSSPSPSQDFCASMREFSLLKLMLMLDAQGEEWGTTSGSRSIPPTLTRFHPSVTQINNNNMPIMPNYGATQTAFRHFYHHTTVHGIYPLMLVSMSIK